MDDFSSSFQKIIGVYSPLQAKILNSLNCQALWVSGFGISHDRYGLPDLDIISYSEKLESQKIIIESTSAKSIVDIDNGIYNKAAFRKYIETLNEAKPFGICIEDERHPKISALYSKSSGLMDADEFLSYLSIIKNHSSSKIFARTNTLTRNEPTKERHRKIDALLDFGIDTLVLHTKNLSELKSFCDQYATKFKIYVITSLLDEVKIDDFINMGINGAILGHHLFFHNLDSQMAFASSILDNEVIPSINIESREKLNQVIDKREWI